MTAYDLRRAAAIWERIAQSASDKPDMPQTAQAELLEASIMIKRAVRYLSNAADRMDAD